MKLLHTQLCKTLNLSLLLANVEKKRVVYVVTVTLNQGGSGAPPFHVTGMFATYSYRNSCW